MKLGLIQTTHSPMCNFLSREFPFSPGECAAMQERQVQQNLSLLSAASGKGYDLLVTTECINYIRLGPDTPTDISLYPELDCSHVEALSHSTREAESYLVAGFGYREGSQAYNAALVFDRRGNLLHRYHKIHLAGDENRTFTPGQDFCVVEGDFGTFGVCICWDMQFPETARTLALGGASLVVCPTWGWEADLYGKARAYENRIFAAAAMAVPAWGLIQSPRTPSSLISPMGEILAMAGTTDSMLLSCRCPLEQAAASKKMRLDGRRPQLYKALTK